ncbi:MAG: hypothetical protein F4109_01200 [Gammaproteobacteria bacterium]|nr:hypothetical protein [Gammaproteobacteria bacterium]
MKILFDHGVPKGLRECLHEHDIDTAAERGWDRLANGALMDRAEANGYDLFLTNDKRIPWEHDLSKRAIKVVGNCVPFAECCPYNQAIEPAAGNRRVPDNQMEISA